MARTSRYHLDGDPSTSLTPRALTKEEFGRRLHAEIINRGWNQSEMARRADLRRDAVSTYVRGTVLPSPTALRKLADALGMEPSDLLPNSAIAAIDSDHSSLSMKVSSGAPNTAWLHVNRLVTVETAAQVIQMVTADAKKMAER